MLFMNLKGEEKREASLVANRVLCKHDRGSSADHLIYYNGARETGFDIDGRSVGM